MNKIPTVTIEFYDKPDFIDEKAKYFVLRYDDFGDDPKHIRACKIALLVYAKLIENHLPLLSKYLKKYIKL